MNIKPKSFFEINPKNQIDAISFLKTELEKQKYVLFYSSNNHENLPIYERYLSEEELSDYKSMTIETRKKQYLTSRWMLKTLLSILLKKDAKEISFVKGQLGKPQLMDEINPESIDFNISHKTNISVLGITQNAKIGIDVEEISESSKSTRIAEKYFNTIEKEWINNQNHRFYRIWSMKEAVIKAAGGGIFQNLDEFYLDSSSEGYSLVSQIPPWNLPYQWNLFELPLPNNLICSVAIYKPSIQV